MSFILCENCGKILYKMSLHSDRKDYCTIQFTDENNMSDEFKICKDCYNKLRSQVAENYKAVHDAVKNTTLKLDLL